MTSEILSKVPLSSANDNNNSSNSGASSNSAKKRWRLLARALTRSSDSIEGEIIDENEEISVRRFTSFDLLHSVLVESEPDCTWWLYTALLDGKLYYEILVRRISKCFTANELIGFNNTGNICVWPSEECLAYYLIKNPEICRRRRVLELGGGMSCLAGLLAGKYCDPSSVTLTDGNVTSVENVRCIVQRNKQAKARCAVIQWAMAANALRRTNRALQEFNGEGSYEVILCADCLFFDDARVDLVDTIYGWLANDGVALVMAPRRGTTFRQFVEAAVERGFLARQRERYDSEVWSRHLHLLQTNREADYWKSQARKFCDFCKCWIADNKPSIEFHESGKKHKENVSKRLKEIHRNSAKQAKQQKKYEDDMQKMEKAAMAAYLKDVEGSTRDLMADNIIQQKWAKEQEPRAEQAPVNPNETPDAAPEAHPRFNGTVYREPYGPADIDPLDPYAKQKLARLAAREAKAKKASNKEKKDKSDKKKNKESQQTEASGSTIPVRKVWYEARSQGHSYYWNIDTNETSWEPPIEGFMSLGEQAEEAKEQALQEEFLTQIDEENEEQRTEILKEQKANAEREKLREIRKKFEERKKSHAGDEESQSEEDKIPYRRDYSVPEKSQPYGAWRVVETPKIDLQLPKNIYRVPDTPVVIHEEPPPPRVFKEKVITKIINDLSDDEGSGISFKKRKFANKNVRRRMDDD